MPHTNCPGWPECNRCDVPECFAHSQLKPCPDCAEG